MNYDRRNNKQIEINREIGDNKPGASSGTEITDITTQSLGSPKKIGKK